MIEAQLHSTRSGQDSLEEVNVVQQNPIKRLNQEFSTLCVGFPLSWDETPVIFQLSGLLCIPIQAQRGVSALAQEISQLFTLQWISSQSPRLSSILGGPWDLVTAYKGSYYPCFTWCNLCFRGTISRAITPARSSY